MDKLTQLIENVKEEGLTKSQLEVYHTEITYLDNQMRMELAPLEKEEALFFQENKKMTKVTAEGYQGYSGLQNTETITVPDIAIKRMWRATEKGQRQIELSHYLKVTPKLLQSLRTRLYNVY